MDTRKLSTNMLHNQTGQNSTAPKDDEVKNTAEKDSSSSSNIVSTVSNGGTIDGLTQKVNQSAI
jgi:hypothetical protein